MKDKKNKLYKTGSEARHWKGGKYIEPNGYVRLTLEKDDPFYEATDKKGTMREHRYVMAKHIGRPLTEFEHVHHINGIKDDNRIENLELIDPSTHLLITKLEARIKELENSKVNKDSYKILFLNPDRGHTCSFYRSGGVVKDLRHKLGANYIIDVVSWPDMPTDWQTISNYDIVMMQRPYMGSMLDFARRIKAMNIPLWLDYDDNLFTVAPENRAWAVFNDPEVQKNVKTFLQIADVITVTNDDLKEAYLHFNKNIIVIPNAFNDSIFNVDREVKERENTILWRGSDTHIYDIMSYAPAITTCTKEHPEYEFTYVGYYPWFLAGSKNVNFIKPMEVIDYFNYINNVHAKAVQIPLVDNNFNRCKSNIAFIEGSYWGAVCIIPEWWGDIPGTLTYKDQESYYAALNKIVNDEINIKEMNEKAWLYIKDNLLLSNINTLRVNIIKDLLHA